MHRLQNILYTKRPPANVISAKNFPSENETNLDGQQGRSHYSLSYPDYNVVLKTNSVRRNIERISAVSERKS